MSTTGPREVKTIICHWSFDSRKVATDDEVHNSVMRTKEPMR
jgi:hypothetical protein